MNKLILIVMENEIFFYENQNSKVVPITYKGEQFFPWDRKSMTSDFNSCAEYLRNEFSILEFYDFAIDIHSNNIKIIEYAIEDAFSKAEINYYDISNTMNNIIGNLGRKIPAAMEYGVNFDGRHYIRTTKKSITIGNYNLLAVYIDANTYIQELGE